LKTSGLGLGWLAALDLLQRDGAAQSSNPLAPKTAPRPADQALISLFMQGGPSQVDTYDPKPLLARLNGQRPPASFGNEDFQNGKLQDTVLLGSRRTFQRYGQSGLEVSDLFPHTAPLADDRPWCALITGFCIHGAVPDSQRLAAHRPPEPGLVGALRFGFGE
jgi:hypothetical protein